MELLATLDLNVANKRNIDDVDDDEQEDAPFDSDGYDGPPDDPDEPPRQRRRLAPLPRLDSGEDLNMDFEMIPLHLPPQLDLRMLWI